MQRAIEEVHIDDSVAGYIVDLVAATRVSSRIELGASPRGSLALYKLSRCRAAFEGRDYVLEPNMPWDKHYLHGDGWTARGR